jgi:hypothetical protein
MSYWSGSFPRRVYINLSHRDTLSYEWQLVRCSHLIVYLVYCCWIEDMVLDMTMIILSLLLLLYLITFDVDMGQRSACLCMF